MEAGESILYHILSIRMNRLAIPQKDTLLPCDSISSSPVLIKFLVLQQMISLVDPGAIRPGILWDLTH